MPVSSQGVSPVIFSQQMCHEISLLKQLTEIYTMNGCPQVKSHSQAQAISRLLMKLPVCNGSRRPRAPSLLMSLSSLLKLVASPAPLVALRMTQSIASSKVELHIVLWTPSDKEQPVSTASLSWKRIPLLTATWRQKKNLVSPTMSSSSKFNNNLPITFVNVQLSCYAIRLSFLTNHYKE